MIALINGSPKRNGSTSEALLNDLKSAIDTELVETGLHRPVLETDSLEKIAGADTWVFAFPLYVGGVPSHLLACLTQLELTARDKRRRVYAIVNCGFYEGIQNELALSIIENFCVRAGCAWGGGIGVGGGGALSMLPKTPDGKGPRRPVEQALKALAENIMSGSSQENRYVTVGIPRVMYRLAGQMGWRRQIKDNGGKTRDLGKRIP